MRQHSMKWLAPHVSRSPLSLLASTVVLLQALLSAWSYRYCHLCSYEVLAFAPTYRCNGISSGACSCVCTRQLNTRIRTTDTKVLTRKSPAAPETKKGRRSASKTSKNGAGGKRKRNISSRKNANTSDEDSSATNNRPEEQKPTETLAGGPALIFAMARRMLVWDDESYVGQNDTYRGDGSGRGSAATATATATAAAATRPRAAATAKAASRPGVLPRWHPHGGISDVNPSFRSSPPAMNSRGYAAAIKRNARKRNKPASWRHALRTYYRMKNLEQEATREAKDEMAEAATAADGDTTTNTAIRPRGTVKRSAPHHEGAIVACSKLGLWREAFRIYEEATSNGDTQPLSSGDQGKSRRGVTDNMILGLVRAAVRGSKSSEMKSKDVQFRREPLDKISQILLNLEVRADRRLDPTVMILIPALFSCDSSQYL